MNRAPPAERGLIAYSNLVRRIHAGPPEAHPINLAFHLHVPRTGGISVRRFFRIGGFALNHFDMNASAFVDDPMSFAPDRSVLMTGHFRLDAKALRECQMPHTVVTMLRDPIDRILSHYNHALAVEGNPWHEQVLSGEMSFLQYAETFLQPGSVGPQYGFFDDTGPGTFAWSGKSDVNRCLDNLFSKVGLFGLTERLSDFPKLAKELLQQPLRQNDLSRHNVSADHARRSQRALKLEISDSERARLTDLFADDLFFYEKARREYLNRHGK